MKDIGWGTTKGSRNVKGVEPHHVCDITGVMGMGCVMQGRGVSYRDRVGGHQWVGWFMQGWGVS